MFFKLCTASLLPLLFAWQIHAKTTFASDQLFENLKSSVIQVVTSIGPESPKKSYGTGFYVAKDRVMTNFHVVADHFWSPDRFLVYIKRNNQRLKAKVVGVDVVHDLALLETQVFDGPILSFSNSPSKQGSTVYSLGLPEDLNMAIVSGTYNNLLQTAPYEQIHLSSPINSGMSGGPTVNEQGEVIGVNVAKLFFSENIGFAVPAKYALKLLDSDQRLPLRKQMFQQLFSAQNVLSKKLLQHRETKQVGPWLLRRMPDSVRCWSDRNSRAHEDRVDYTTEICQMSGSSFLSESEQTVYVQTEVNSYVSKKLNLFQLYALLNRSFSPSMTSTEQSFSKTETPTWTKFECWSKRYQLTFQGETLVETCIRRLVAFSDLFDAQVKVLASADGGKGLVARMRLNGFSKDNLLRLIMAWLPSIGAPSAI